MVHKSTLNLLVPFLQDQWGLVTRRQAEAAGISKATLQRITSPGSILKRVSSGVYRMSGAPIPDHLDLRAAWLQLAPGTPAWERTQNQGVVSHRSAAAVYRIGHFASDVQEFTLTKKKSIRRADVRLHTRRITEEECEIVQGLPVTRPPRICSDLLFQHEDPEGVGQLIADAIRHDLAAPSDFTAALASHALKFGLRRGDGIALFRWIVGLVDADEARAWIQAAQSTNRDVQFAAQPLKTVP